MSEQYEFAFIISSLAVHADWHFMSRYNLIHDHGQYLPNHASAPARPQIIETVNYLILKTAISYLDNFDEGEDKKKITGVLKPSSELD